MRFFSSVFAPAKCWGASATCWAKPWKNIARLRMEYSPWSAGSRSSRQASQSLWSRICCRRKSENRGTMKRFPYQVLCQFAAVALFLLPQSFAQAHSDRRPAHTLVYVGTYGANAKGIYAFRFGEDLETPTDLGLAAEVANPFFLTASHDGRFLYSTNMGKLFRGQTGGSVSAYAIDRKSGRLTPINQVSSRGADPAYISVDKTGKFALIANYTGGSVGVIP